MAGVNILQINLKLYLPMRYSETMWYPQPGNLKTVYLTHRYYICSTTVKIFQTLKELKNLLLSFQVLKLSVVKILCCLVIWNPKSFVFTPASPLCSALSFWLISGQCTRLITCENLMVILAIITVICCNPTWSCSRWGLEGQPLGRNLSWCDSAVTLVTFNRKMSLIWILNLASSC